jgi:hypothetical protein
MIVGVPRTGLDHRQRPHDLLREHGFGMSRGSKDLHEAQRHIDDEFDTPIPRYIGASSTSRFVRLASRAGC